MMSLMSLQLQSAYQGNLTWSMKSRSLSKLLWQFWPPNPKDNWRFQRKRFSPSRITIRLRKRLSPSRITIITSITSRLLLLLVALAVVLLLTVRDDPDDKFSTPLDSLFFQHSPKPFSLYNWDRIWRIKIFRTIFWDQHTFCPELPVVLNQPSHHSQWLHCFYTFPL